MTPFVVVAEFVFTQAGEAEFLPHVDRTLAEVRGTEGCLHAELWTRPGRRYQFSTVWSDGEALNRWVANEFHESVLMPGFRAWCSEGWFGEYTILKDHPRAHRCETCGGWTRTRPGWSERGPNSCAKCGEPPRRRPS